MEARQERGRQIAATKRIKRAGKLWLVPSQSHTGTYVVDDRAGTCTCPDHELNHAPCKHMFAVQYTRHQVTNADGTKTVTETMRVTYTQDWPAYNAAQKTEKDHVQRLLAGLCAGIVQPPQGKGRPRLSLADVVYGATMKVYTTFSGRRATTDIRACEDAGHIDHAPSYNSIFRYLESEALTPLLKTLVEESAEPLKAIESDFAVDATGFATTVYNRWFDHKYGKEVSKARWVKAHAMVGVRTNVVTSVEVTEGDRHDSPEMPALLAATAKRFNVAEVSADKGYLSHNNLAAIAAVGAVGYVPFKSNSQGNGSEQWQNLWHLYWYKRPQFLAHYHQRSNAEATFSMIKRKFGGAVRSKLFTAQVNEVLAKVLCHNLVVLVHSFHELGIESPFEAGSRGAPKVNHAAGL